MRVVWVATALILGLGAGGLPARAETLDEALASAYQSNPRMAAARASLRVSGEVLSEATTAFRPDVNLSLSAGRAEIDLQGRSPDYVNTTSGQVQVSQPILPLAGFAGVNSAEARVEEQRARLNAVEQQLFLQVVGAYLDVLRDTALVGITGDIARNLTQEVSDNRKRFEQGDVTRTDIDQVQARLSQVQADLASAGLNLKRSRAAYEELVGHPPENLTPPGTPAALPANRDEAVDQALANNALLAFARQSEAVAQRDIARAEAEFFPTLNAVGSANSLKNESFGGSREDTARIELRLNVPLYQGGATQSRIRRAKELLRQRQAETLQNEREIVHTTAAAWDALVSTRQVIDYARGSVAAADSALSGTREEAKLGYRTTIDVLIAEQDLLQARRSVVTAEREQAFAGWQLLGAIGRLDARQQALPIPLYDDHAHAAAARGAWFSTTPMADGMPPQATSTGLRGVPATAPPPSPAVAPPAKPAGTAAPAGGTGTPGLLDGLFDWGDGDAGTAPRLTPGARR